MFIRSMLEYTTRLFYSLRKTNKNWNRFQSIKYLINKSNFSDDKNKTLYLYDEYSKYDPHTFKTELINYTTKRKKKTLKRLDYDSLIGYDVKDKLKCVVKNKNIKKQYRRQEKRPRVKEYEYCRREERYLKYAQSEKSVYYNKPYYVDDCSECYSFNNLDDICVCCLYCRQIESFEDFWYYN